MLSVDKLLQRYPTEDSIRTFFESIIWPHGRHCVHCGFKTTYPIKGDKTRKGLYECNRCKGQFTVTTKTPMHSTKLSLLKWLMAIYYIVNSSKGIASVVLARWIGVSQKTAWKMGHAIRVMMASESEIDNMLSGIVEVDETYVGGKSRLIKEHPKKRGKGTDKQLVFVATERHGKVRSAPVKSDKISELKPVFHTFIDKKAHLMTDGNRAYPGIAKDYAGHDSVIHSALEFSRGQIHTNTVESFNSLFKRARMGVFHYMSKQHLTYYLSEAGFRWNHRKPREKHMKNGKKKIVMVPIPVLDMIKSLLQKALGIQLRRSKNGGIRLLAESPPIF